MSHASTRTARRAARVFAVLILAMTGCGGGDTPAGSSTPMTDTSNPQPTDATADSIAPVEPVTQAGVPGTAQPDAPSTPVAKPVEPKQADERVETPAPATTTDAYRPEWWLEEPTIRDGRLTATASGEGGSLVAANRASLAAGRSILAAELKRQGVADAETLAADCQTEMADAQRLDDATWRAFVLVSVPLAE